MNILYLLTQDLDSPTGVGRFFPLARELTRLGHHIRIVALHGNYKALEKTHFIRDGVEVQYVGQMHVQKIGNQKKYFNPIRLIWISTYATFALSKAMLSYPFDIVHIAKPHPMNGIPGLLAKYILRKHFIVDCSDYEAATNYFSGEWQRVVIAIFENNLPHLADRITTHATFLRDRLLSMGVPPWKIAYLPNGVDYERFNEIDDEELSKLRTSLGLQDCRVVAFIGTLTAHAHAVDLLMDAFKLILEEIPNTRLLIVGGGEKFEYLQNLAKSLGISNESIFCGRISPQKISLYYHLADISVDPVYDNPITRSRFPIKLFESWAAGVPFVTADVGDRRSLLEYPQAGLLAKPGDAASLANAILYILKNPILAEEIRQNGLERAKAFDWKIIAKELEKLYLSLSNKK